MPKGLKKSIALTFQGSALEMLLFTGPNATESKGSGKRESDFRVCVYIYPASHATEF